MTNRYSLDSTRELTDRQIRIWGEKNQETLQNSNVLVVGEDYVSEMVLAGLVGLGIGNILIMSNPTNSITKPSFLSPDLKQKRCVKKFPTVLNQINPFVNIKVAKSYFSRSLLNYYNFNPNAIIDTTNDNLSKMKILDYLEKRKGKIFLSSYSGQRKSNVTRFNSSPNNCNLLLDSQGINEDSEQGIVPSGIASGIMLEELRKGLIPLEGDSLLERKIRYNLDASDRISATNLQSPARDLKNLKCLVAGAGGIGTYVALNLALSGFKKIDILDYDEIHESNMNRQILFYGMVGEKKAKILRERIKKITPTNSQAFSSEENKITSDSFNFLRRKNYSMIFGCFDNVRARYLLNYFSVDLKIPYIDGGTSISRGSVFTYLPNKSSCVSCKKNLKLEEEVRHSCDHADPSVVMPNMIVGSLMVGEAINILSGIDKSCETIAYDNNDPKRIYQKPSPPKKGGCRC